MHEFYFIPNDDTFQDTFFSEGIGDVYCILLNYHTMHLDFSNIQVLGKIVVEHVPSYTKGTLKKKISEGLMKCLCNVFFVCMCFFFISNFFL